MFLKQNQGQTIESVPVHVAFIMDGNGRWAKKRGLPRLAGHNSGTETLKNIVKVSQRVGISYISFYAFSTENWKRPSEEVSGLMKLLVKYIRSEIEEIHSNNIKINVLGNIETLPEYARKEVVWAIEKTRENSGMNFNIALNYGGRDEILSAVKKISARVSNGEILLDQIDEKLFSDHLYTAGMPDPDLMIRTSGEQRLSNFMLWQMAYTEFIFESCYWPDFSEKVFMSALEKFKQRNRRFGSL